MRFELMRFRAMADAAERFASLLIIFADTIFRFIGYAFFRRLCACFHDVTPLAPCLRRFASRFAFDLLPDYFRRRDISFFFAGFFFDALMPFSLPLIRRQPDACHHYDFTLRCHFSFDIFFAAAMTLLFRRCFSCCQLLRFDAAFAFDAALMPLTLLIFTLAAFIAPLMLMPPIFAIICRCLAPRCWRRCRHAFRRFSLSAADYFSPPDFHASPSAPFFAAAAAAIFRFPLR